MSPVTLNSFEKRVLYFTSIANGLFASTGILLAYVLEYGQFVMLMFGIDAVNNFVLAYLTRVKPNYRIAALSFINNMVFLLYGWYIFGNMNNLPNLVAVAMIAEARIVLNSRPKIVSAVSWCFGIALILLHLGALFLPEYIPVIRHDMVIFDLLVTALTYSFISLAMKRYSKQVLVEQRTVQEQKEELATQNEELQVSNEELYANQEEILAQREEIERQHFGLQRANNNLLHSINYANRIQKALFSSSIEKLNNKGSFVIDMPRDIVSGDFCFVREVNNVIYIIQGDCTGHGVPGAILTVIATELLDKIIVDKQCWSPKKILTRLDEEMRFRLKNEGRANLDGLEAGVLAIDNNLNVALFAGAKRPLIFWDSTTNQYRVIKGTKKAVGNSMNVESEYREEVFKVNTGDRFYLFTDGFVDQFGGDYDKKYSNKRFLNTIAELTDIKISEQAEVLTEEFINWKGDKRQIDDVMVLGVEV
ncbi:SpoIIE family protein phosphatase [Limibacter armeniacum]|uniref:PP2C family protein-serine/threonine phosphatase n=1 Tax=Limibacter armeniacum TaxID=466084 RepID=UPI002FE65C1A